VEILEPAPSKVRLSRASKLEFVPIPGWGNHPYFGRLGGRVGEPKQGDDHSGADLSSEVLFGGYHSAVTDFRAVCVFCGSSTPPHNGFRDAARALGVSLAGRGIELVYGGGRVGLMGELADSCLARGGRVTGVIPTGLFALEVGHRGITELHQVGSMHERKQLMYDLADAFVALPGGFGTLEELAEVATWSQLGLHRKPIVLLDVDDFWDPLVALLDRMVAIGFLKPANRELIQRARSPEEALNVLASAKPTYVEKWITDEER